MLQYGKCTPKASLYNSCIISDDCKSAGNLCYNRHDVKCICKSGQCKVSSGCGVTGYVGIYKSCSSCNVETALTRVSVCCDMECVLIKFLQIQNIPCPLK